MTTQLQRIARHVDAFPERGRRHQHAAAAAPAPREALQQRALGRLPCTSTSTAAAASSQTWLRRVADAAQARAAWSSAPRCGRPAARAQSAASCGHGHAVGRLVAACGKSARHVEPPPARRSRTGCPRAACGPPAQAAGLGEPAQRASSPSVAEVKIQARWRARSTCARRIAGRTPARCPAATRPAAAACGRRRPSAPASAGTAAAKQLDAAPARPRARPGARSRARSRSPRPAPRPRRQQAACRRARASAAQVQSLRRDRPRRSAQRCRARAQRPRTTRRRSRAARSTPAASCCQSAQAARLLQARGQHVARRSRAPARCQLSAEELHAGLVELVRLVEDRRSRTDGQQFGHAGFAHRQVGEEQVVVDHHHVGRQRLAPRLVHVAAAELRAVAPRQFSRVEVTSGITGERSSSPGSSARSPVRVSLRPLLDACQGAQPRSGPAAAPNRAPAPAGAGTGSCRGP